MTKTLVTIGYHYGEIQWGIEVAMQYFSRCLMEGRDIHFYVLMTSNVKSADLCPSALKEIERVYFEGRFGVWIDLHCGIDASSNGKTYLFYTGENDLILAKARALVEVKVGDYRQIPDPPFVFFRQSAMVDPFFSPEDFNAKKGYYPLGLEKTLRFINQIYDIHE